MTWLPAFVVGWLLGCAFMYVMDRSFLLERHIQRVMRREREATVRAMTEVLDKVE